MTWEQFIEREQDKEYYKELMTFIDKEYQNKVVFPKQKNIFKAFELSQFNDVKVIILGQDPYHDVHQAHGLAFSVNKDVKIPPSLRNIYKELYSDIGLLPPSHGDLTKWATQGVLLLNTVLTVEAHQANSHKGKGWEIFTDNVIKELNQDDSPKVFVLWGNHSIKKENLINNSNHLVIKSSHPSPLSARHSFFGSKVFSRINAFLRENKIEEIDYTLT